MSRTLKDRPYRVLKEDPKTRRRASHNHLAYLREKVGEEKVVTQEEVIEWYGKHYMYYQPEKSYMYPVYRRWTEVKPCTLDLPQVDLVYRNPNSFTNEEKMARKDCHYQLEYYPNIKSGKYWKQKTNRAIRANVHQQLRMAKNMDPEVVDIYSDTMYDSRGWWEW